MLGTVSRQGTQIDAKSAKRVLAFAKPRLNLTKKAWVSPEVGDKQLCLLLGEGTEEIEYTVMGKAIAVSLGMS
jgi:hypothetical protein